MFFPAFTSNGFSPVSTKLIFTIESQASQVIAEAETSFIQKAVENNTLPEDLFWEVEFFGSIPVEERKPILEYFHSHKASLDWAALKILNDPNKAQARDAILHPIKSLNLV